MVVLRKLILIDKTVCAAGRSVICHLVEKLTREWELGIRISKEHINDTSKRRDSS